MRQPRLSRTIVAAVGLMLVGAAALCIAGSVPETMGYDGYLLPAAAGAGPLEGETGIEFRIYGSPQGSDLLWVERWNAVEVVEGRFHVKLGSNGSPLPPLVFAAGARVYLEVVPDGATPAGRQRIESASGTGTAPSEPVEALAEGEPVQPSPRILLGGAEPSCPVNTVRIADWCIDAFIRPTANWSAATLDCNADRMEICSVEALLVCDLLNAPSQCAISTDTPGARIWTSTYDRAFSSQLFEGIVIYDGNGTASGSSVGAQHPFYCCKPLGSPQ